MRCSTRAQELFGALRAGDARRARALLDGDNREELLDEVDSEAFLKDLRLAPIALALLDLFLGPGSPVLDATVRLSLGAPQDALFHAVMRHAPKNAEIGNVLAANAIGSAAGAQFVERALAGLDQVIAQKGVGAYARMLALLAIHPRQSHLLLDEKRARRYLAAALPFAVQEPLINFHAACLFIELGEPESALTQPETALANGFDDLKMTRGEPTLASLRKTSRFKALR